ncbi:MAG: TolB-like translocation protein [Catenulispora sp.]|nr:TolB-like translocation protein [Catenulispora sp.]
MSAQRRLLILLAAVFLLAGAGTATVLRAAEQTRTAASDGPPVDSGTVTLAAPHDGAHLLFRTMTWGPHRDQLATVPLDRPDAVRTAASPTCLRFHTAAGTGICLQAVHSLVQDTYRAVILDAGLHELRHFDLAGIPTRARVSPSGHLVAWTVFVSGDTYAGSTFSTRTSILDTRTWALQENLEDFAVVLNGRPYRSPDVNIWGVTFVDDDHFYATLAAGGSTHLVAGDVSRRTLTGVHDNVECPSLSPDGTRIAYKKRVPGLSPDAPWRLYVLDVRTMTESATAEQRNVDDQALWLDDSTLAYSLPSDDGTDLWSVPADGSGAAALLARAALSPAVVR